MVLKIPCGSSEECIKEIMDYFEGFEYKCSCIAFVDLTEYFLTISW